MRHSSAFALIALLFRNLKVITCTHVPYLKSHYNPKHKRAAPVAPDAAQVTPPVARGYVQ
jgi:hypothetical protein